MERNKGFLPYHFYKAIQCVKERQQAKLYNAIFEYEFENKIEDFKDDKECKAIFNVMLPFLQDFIDKQDKKTDRNCIDYKEWRKKVFERDNYTCRNCGQIGGELNAHHIKHFATNKELRFDLDNGITLCKSCHLLVHSKRR